MLVEGAPAARRWIGHLGLLDLTPCSAVIHRNTVVMKPYGWWDSRPHTLPEIQLKRNPFSSHLFVQNQKENLENLHENQELVPRPESSKKQKEKLKPRNIYIFFKKNWIYLGEDNIKKLCTSFWISHLGLITDAGIFPNQK